MTVDAAALEEALMGLQAALRAGDLTQLAALLDAVTETAARGVAGDAATLARLRATAAQNDRLLAATLRGLRSARRRLAELQAAQAGFATYDSGGRRTCHPEGTASLCKRL